MTSVYINAKPVNSLLSDVYGPISSFFVYLNIFVLARKEWLRREKQI